jgi:hypothetical protein
VTQLILSLRITVGGVQYPHRGVLFKQIGKRGDTIDLHRTAPVYISRKSGGTYTNSSGYVFGPISARSDNFLEGTLGRFDVGVHVADIPKLIKIIA